jgi:zeta-carotene desaturase
MTEDVLIIGGGFAGLAAGVALAKEGTAVRLLEQKPHLGGRACSFLDSATGSVVDNGQHLFMGCYHRTIEFLKTIGTLDRVKFQPALTVPFVGIDGCPSVLQCPQLPAPWHLLIGVLRSNSFTWREKFQILGMRRALGGAASPPNDLSALTVDQWLSGLGQSESVRRKFWNLICIGVMNEDPGIASAQLFERVLKLALFSSSRDSSLGLARVGLSECYTQAAADYISSRGGKVELSTIVRGLQITDGVCAGVTLVDGERISARAVINATPWNKFTGILPPELLRSEPYFTRILSLRPAPIISINLWFDRPITDLEFVGLRGTTLQWLFNKSMIFSMPERGSSAANCQYVSLVLSGAHEHIAKAKEELLSLALREIGQLLPPAKNAKLVHSLVIKERSATFSPAVGMESARPAARTPIRGLYLAGDWTATGLPATIEGAVKSGYTAAGEILQEV